MQIQVYNSSDRLVFQGTPQEFKTFKTNDSDRIVFINKD